MTYRIVTLHEHAVCDIDLDSTSGEPLDPIHEARSAIADSRVPLRAGREREGRGEFAGRLTASAEERHAETQRDRQRREEDVLVLSICEMRIFYNYSSVLEQQID